jgi:hypothetical protein
MVVGRGDAVDGGAMQVNVKVVAANVAVALELVLCDIWWIARKPRLWLAGTGRGGRAQAGLGHRHGPGPLTCRQLELC